MVTARERTPLTLSLSSRQTAEGPGSGRPGPRMDRVYEGDLTRRLAVDWSYEQSPRPSPTPANPGPMTPDVTDGVTRSNASSTDSSTSAGSVPDATSLTDIPNVFPTQANDAGTRSYTEFTSAAIRSRSLRRRTE